MYSQQKPAVVEQVSVPQSVSTLQGIEKSILVGADTEHTAEMKASKIEDVPITCDNPLTHMGSHTTVLQYCMVNFIQMQIRQVECVPRLRQSFVL